MPDRLRRLGLPAAILLLLATVVTGLLLGGGRPADRAYELEQRLRCPVCKTVSIAESQSDTAVAMRAVVEEQIADGRSDEEIIGYFTQRYGEWVLMDPPASGDTLPVWLLPVGVALAGVVFVLTRPRRAAATVPLSDTERARVSAEVARLRGRHDDEDEW